MAGVDCGKARVALDAYRDGELAQEERGTLEAHLAACPDCAARLADRQALGGLLRLRAEALGGDLPDGFSARVMAALPPAPKRFPVGLRGRLLLGFLAAAAVSAAVLLPLLGQPLPGARRSAAENEAHVHRLAVTGPGAQPLVFQNDLGETVVWVVPDSDEQPPPGH